MDIFTFSEGLHEQLKTMTASGSSKQTLTHSSDMIGLIQELLHDLQQFTYNYTFSSQQDEIKFFKEVKPVLLSQYYYYKKLFDIALYDSFKDVHAKTKYYQTILSKLEFFARKHHAFYRYCMTGQTYFDESYFIRKPKMFSGLMDIRFSTGYDDKLGQLLANELIRNHVLELLQNVHGDKTTSMIWTGNKTDAIELLVALHSSGIINNGELELRRFVQEFEHCFNIRLDNYYDFLKNIRLRKGGRTNFLDGLKQKFVERLDQMET